MRQYCNWAPLTQVAVASFDKVSKNHHSGLHSILDGECAGHRRRCLHHPHPCLSQNCHSPTHHHPQPCVTLLLTMHRRWQSEHAREILFSTILRVLLIAFTMAPSSSMSLEKLELPVRAQEITHSLNHSSSETDDHRKDLLPRPEKTNIENAV